jgi:hypothetical protein
MKNYYFNPKTHDLLIFDTESNTIDVLKVLKGIRVITEFGGPDGTGTLAIERLLRAEGEFTLPSICSRLSFPLSDSSRLTTKL